MAAQTETTGEVVCPECGRKFKRPSALGAHRWQAHRVAGSSPQARSRRRTGKSAAGGRTSAASLGTEARTPATGDFVVDRLHPLGVEGPGIFDPLLADLAPPRLLGRIVGVCSP